MDALEILAVVVVLAIVAVAGWYFWQRRRTEQLQATYGPEYSRAVEDAGDRRRAEDELLRRKQRVDHLEIRPLPLEYFTAFTRQWRAVQADFVDDPNGAVRDADRLVEEVMKARGYPIADFEQRAADLSVHHPRVVQNYRSARDIARRHRRGEATTEDLRQAMVFYRELFEDLLADRESESRPTEREVERVIEREEVVARSREEIEAARPVRTDREVRQ